MTSKPDKKKLLLQTPKGMHDILHEEYLFYQNIIDKAEEISSYYGFQPIQTPVLEKTDLFIQGTGVTTDIVQRQMYNLKTRGGDHLTLRPEGTPSIMRSYLEHGMHTWPQPVMLWYRGSFFRHERPQKGRFREFQQFGLEIIGEEKSIAEAMIIQVLKLTLEELGIGPIVVHINSLGDKECRSNYRKDLVTYYRKNNNKLCDDCKRRLKENPLRLLDCKEEKCIELKEEAPQMISYLCTACKQHFKETLEILDASGIPYLLNNHLVRGLDYYSRTVFEIFEDREELPENTEDTDNKKIDKNPPLAIAAGGRYDGLSKTLSKKDFPATGGAIGVDRVVQLMRKKNITARNKRAPKVFLIQLGAAAKSKSLNIIEIIRKAGIPLSQSISKDSLRSQLKLAEKLNVSYALILGQKEALEDTIIIRNMRKDSQETIPMEKVVEVIKDKLKHTR